jgi:TP901 family phage tail tape measure protein
MTLGKLLISLGLEKAGFDRGLDEAVESTGGFASRMTNLGGSLTKGVTLPLAALGAAAFANAVKVGNMADTLLDLSTQTGLSTRSLQEFRRVTTVAGVGADTIANAAMSLTRRLSATDEESKKVAETLGALGVSVRDSSGRLRDMDDILPEMITSLQGVENTVERNALAIQLFGRGATELAPVLGMTADEFENLRKEAHDMGLVLGDDALGAANDFRVQWDTLRQSLSGSIATIGVQLIPIMSSLVAVLSENVIPAVSRVVGWLGELSPTTQKWIAGIGALLAMLGPFLTVIGLLAKGLPLVAAGFTAIKTAILLLSGPVGWAIGAAALITIAWLKWGDDIKRIVRETVEKVQEWLGGRLSAIADRVGGTIDRVIAPFKKMYDLVVGNSYVPDMMKEIESEFKKLEEIMVRPAELAADKVAAAMMRMQLAGPQLAGAGLTMPGIVGAVAAPSRPPVEVDNFMVALVETESRLRSWGESLTWEARDMANQFRHPKVAAREFGLMAKDAGMGVLQAFTPLGIASLLLSEVMKHLQPVIESLMEPIRIVAQALAGLLAPALRIVEPLLRWMAIGLTYLGEVVARIAQGLSFAVGAAIRAIGQAIDRIPFVSGGPLIRAGQSLLDFSDSMGDAAKGFREAREELRNPVDRLEDAVDDAADSMDRLSSSVDNVVQGYKIAGARHMASSSMPVTASPTIGGSGVQGAGSGATVYPAPVTVTPVSMEVTINTSGEGRETYREFYGEVDRRTRASGGAAREWFLTLPEPV